MASLNPNYLIFFCGAAAAAISCRFPQLHPGGVVHHAGRKLHQHSLGANVRKLFGESILRPADGVDIGERQHKVLGEARLEAAGGERVLHAKLVEELAVDAVNRGLRRCDFVEDRDCGPRRSRWVLQVFETRRHLGLESAESRQEGMHRRTSALTDRVERQVFDLGSHHH